MILVSESLITKNSFILCSSAYNVNVYPSPKFRFIYLEVPTINSFPLPRIATLSERNSASSK